MSPQSCKTTASTQCLTLLLKRNAAKLTVDPTWLSARRLRRRSISRVKTNIWSSTTCGPKIPTSPSTGASLASKPIRSTWTTVSLLLVMISHKSLRKSAVVVKTVLLLFVTLKTSAKWRNIKFTTLLAAEFQLSTLVILPLSFTLLDRMVLSSSCRLTMISTPLARSLPQQVVMRPSTEWRA